MPAGNRRWWTLGVAVALVAAAVAWPLLTTSDEPSTSDAAPAVAPAAPTVPDAAPAAPATVGEIRGTVVTPDGDAVEIPVVVRLVALDGGARREVRAGPDGAFAIEGVAPGRYALTTRAPGFGPASWPLVEVRAGATSEVELRLDVAAALGGRVLGPDGSPREGDRVSVGVDAPAADLLARMLGRPVGLGDRVVVLTDPAGRYRFDDLAPGRYDLRIEREGRPPRVVRGVAAPDATREVRLEDVRAELEPPVAADEGPPSDSDDAVATGPRALVTGRVVDRDGLPIPGALVRLGDVCAVAGRDGSYRLDAAGDGERWIESGAVGYAVRLDGPYTIPAGASVALPDVVLSRRGLEIRGRVEEASTGAPISGALVVVAIDRPDGGVERLETETDADGDYRIDGPDFDRAVARVETFAAGRRAETREVHPAPVADASFRLVRSAEVRGTVTFAGSVAPRLRARVRRAGGAWRDERCRIDSTTGAYRILGLAPGRCEIELVAPGHAPGGRRRVELGPGAVVDVPPCRLGPGGTVAGRVVDPTGEPLGGVRVTTPDAEARADDDGAFHLENVPPGRVTLYIHAGPRDVASPSFEVEVREGETTRVVLRVSP